MASVEQMKSMTHSELPGVVIYSLGGEVEAGHAQDVLVDAAPGATIPLHTHSVDAQMFIIGGSGWVLSDDPGLSQHPVSRGHLVFFEKHIRHGFVAGENGLQFISRNGGIVDEDEKRWDIAFE